MVFMMAGIPSLRFPEQQGGVDSLAADTVPADTVNRKARTDTVPVDSLGRSLALDSVISDTIGMDSLHKAIWIHNKAVDASLARDSINRNRNNGILNVRLCVV